MFFVSILEQTIVQSRLECVIVCYLFFVFVRKTQIIAKHVYPKLKQKLTCLNRFEQVWVDMFGISLQLCLHQ